MPFYRGHDFSESELATIAAALGPLPSDEDREIRLLPSDERFAPFCREIREATRSYLTNRDAELQRPRAAATRKDLQRFRQETVTFQKALNRFRGQIEGLDERTSGTLATVLAWADLELLDGLNSLPDCLSRVSEAVNESLKEMRLDPGGRPTRLVSLRRYLLELHAIYYDLTGRRAMLPAKIRGRFRGWFFRFCKTTLTLIGHPIASSDIALLSQLKKVKIIKNKLSARKDFDVHPTIPER